LRLRNRAIPANRAANRARGIAARFISQYQQRTIAISRLRGSGVHVELEEATLGHCSLRDSVDQCDVARSCCRFLAAIYRAESAIHIDLHFFGGGAAHLTGRRYACSAR